MRPVRTGTAPKVAEFPAEPVPRSPESALGLLLPAPLQNRRALHWLRATAADFALIGLNWLLIGALLMVLRRFLPPMELQAYAADAPISLLGIAVLHAALVTLVGYTEGLYAAGRPLNQQGRILAKSIAWATVVMGVGYGLQGPFGATMGVFASVGFLHLGALWTWRWQVGRQQLADRSPSDVRNVLIVGACPTGRRIAASLQANPSDGRKFHGFLDDEDPAGDGVIGRVNELARLARTGFVDLVILAAPRDQELAQRTIREARRLRLDVEIVPELYG